MADAALAVLIAVFIWWFGTGAILLLDGWIRRPSTSPLGRAGAVLLASIAALAAVAVSADMPIVAGAYLGFAGGVAVWGLLELAFLSGWLTGARKAPCPPGATGWKRFGFALDAILHHELALFMAAAALCGLLHGAANPTALWTFLILWAMRQSAKLNIFLGVPNLSTEMLPARVGHLASYFRVAPMNWLFPVSITGGTVAGVLATLWAADPSLSAAQHVGATLLATLLWLGVLEHWFLVLPLPETALWRWAMPGGAKPPSGVADQG